MGAVGVDELAQVKTQTQRKRKRALNLSNSSV